MDASLVELGIHGENVAKTTVYSICCHGCPESPFLGIHGASMASMFAAESSRARALPGAVIGPIWSMFSAENSVSNRD
jgi:hypothetical protein